MAFLQHHHRRLPLQQVRHLVVGVTTVNLLLIHRSGQARRCYEAFHRRARACSHCHDVHLPHSTVPSHQPPSVVDTQTDASLPSPATQTMRPQIITLQIRPPSLIHLPSRSLEPLKLFLQELLPRAASVLSRFIPSRQLIHRRPSQVHPALVLLLRRRPDRAAA